METLSHTINARSIAFLGHLIRAPDSDPMKAVTMRNNRPMVPPTRRVGRPKLNWARQAFETAWRAAEANNPNLPGAVQFTGADEQYRSLVQLVESRSTPFDTPKSQINPTSDTQNLIGESIYPATQPGEQRSHAIPGWVSSAPHPPAHIPALHSFVAGAPLAVRIT